MQKFSHILIILFVSVFSTFGNTPQLSQIDSLHKELDKAGHDSISCKIYLELAAGFENEHIDSALYYYDKCIQLANDESLLIYKARALRHKGMAYSGRGNYDLAINTFYESFIIFDLLGQKEGMSKCYNNIGIAHFNQGNYEQTIEYYLKALEIAEEMGDNNLISACYNNIGIVHEQQGNYDLAIDYHLKALKIAEEIGEKRVMSAAYNNIGIIYYYKNDYDKAVRYYKKSLKVDEELGDKHGMSQCYNNIGIVYRTNGDYDNAIKYFRRSLNIFEEIGSKNGMAISSINIASLHLMHANIAEDATDKGESEFHLNKAIEYGSSAFNLGREIKAVPRENEAAKTLMTAYRRLGNFEKAMEYSDVYIATKDSLYHEEKTKAIVEMQTRYETEKKQQEIDKQSLVIERQEIDNKRQRAQRNFFIAGSVLLTLLVIFAYYGYIQKKRNNNTITEKNTLLEQANEEINAQKDEIATQHDMVLLQKKHIEKQKEKITDSITYASVIQNAVLPSGEGINEVLGEHFIIFKPKEIVSGDFYWATKIKNMFVLAVADCTGHGVPGALMSMLGISFLQEIVINKKITKPSLILDKLRDSIIGALKQRGRYGDQREGLNIVLCVLNNTNNTLRYAGANNPLIIVSAKKQLKIVEPDKQPIAIHRKMKPFIEKRLKLSKGDIVYLVSDGFQDQFGGNNYKRFGDKQLKNLLLEISTHNMKDQKTILNQTFDDWKGDNEQIDDVTVMGLKI